MEQVGRAALREAVGTGTRRVAFAPMIKDADNDAIPAGDVENGGTRGVLLAYDTQKRLQKQGFATDFTLDKWIVEAGPTCYDGTIAEVERAVTQAADSVEQRNPKPYSTASR